MKKILILSALCASLMADIQSFTLTPFVGATANSEGEYALTGVRAGANIGNDWAYELTGAMRQNKYYGQTEQDWEYSIIAKKENIVSYGGFDFFAGAGLGKVFNSGGVTATAGALYPLDNGDAIRLDVTTQAYDGGRFDTYGTIGYSFSFSPAKKEKISVETTPVAPVETTPASVAPVTPVETTPVAPVETTPVAPVETTPVASVAESIKIFFSRDTATPNFSGRMIELGRKMHGAEVNITCFADSKTQKQMKHNKDLLQKRLKNAKKWAEIYHAKKVTFGQSEVVMGENPQNRYCIFKIGE
jgi:hypothetical protein